MYAALRVLTPPAATPIALETARRHCRIDYADDDDLLGVYIAQAVDWAEAWLDRALITRALQLTVAEAPSYGAFPLASDPLLLIPVGLTWSQMWRRPIELPRAPAQGITSVTVRGADDVDVVLDASQWRVDLALDPARLRVQTGGVTGPIQHIQVAYTAGYGADASAVPPAILSGLLWLVAHLYENRGDADMEMPSGIAALLWPHRLVSFGG